MRKNWQSTTQRLLQTLDTYGCWSAEQQVKKPFGFGGNITHVFSIIRIDKREQITRPLPTLAIGDTACHQNHGLPPGRHKQILKSFGGN